MISDCGGHLYDTRKPDWAKNPLRLNYRRAAREINTTAELKAALRTKYAWPGGYEIVYLTSDGALLCGECVEKQLRSVLSAIRNRCSDGWRVVGCGYEATSAESTESELCSQCDHCGKDFGEIS
jgi:hypothetical protein